MVLHLLGSPFLQTAQGRVAISPSRPFLLLVYLACRGDWVVRDELAFFLRPDVDKETGQQYLRKLVSNARKLPWLQGLEVETERLRWQVETDVKRFQAARKSGNWREAVELYRGPLVGNLDVPFLPSYDTWLQLEREVLDHEWQDATLNLAGELEGSGQHRDAAALAKTLLEHDPFHEQALQSFLRSTYLMGRREQALKVAHAFAVRLKDELGLEVTPATRALVEAIRLAQPVEKVSNPARYGRRRSDRVQGEPLSGTLAELVAVLAGADSRLLSIGPSDGDETVLFIAKRVSNTRTALYSVVHLAAELIEQGHKSRALELLLLVLNHPACDALLKEEATRVWPGLEQFTQP